MWTVIFTAAVCDFPGYTFQSQGRDAWVGGGELDPPTSAGRNPNAGPRAGW